MSQAVPLMNIVKEASKKLFAEAKIMSIRAAKIVELETKAFIENL